MNNAQIFKTVLKNGLTLLVFPQREIPKVSMQLWYGVGSKDEVSGQRGLAHLIEHMIFKGTDKLSESDINTITYRLSGSCNAFTSNDYTGYLFDIPSQNWQQILPIMADCMNNCSFKEEHLNSELKAVIQELKMYNDDYLSTLIEKMMCSIFPDHPYHYPVIGYKQDLWHVTRDHLLGFYRKFYGPNNATMVIVGDVDVAEATAAVAKEFESIPVLEDFKREKFYHGFDLVSTTTSIHRDIKQPMLLFAWTILGASAKKEYLFDLMSWIIGAGRGASLYAKLVTEMGIATELQSFVYDLFDHGIFFIYVQPCDLKDAQKIEEIILAEIERYIKEGVSDAELSRAERKTKMDLIGILESPQRIAYLLGKLFAATGDENYLLHYDNYPIDSIKKDIHELFKAYFSPVLVHRGHVLPLGVNEKDLWVKQQEVSEAEDALILKQVVREASVEEPIYANSIKVALPRKFDFPKPETFVLDNGLKIFALNKPELGKIDLLIDLKAKHYFDPVGKQGRAMLVADLLQEGTKKRSATELAQELESLGMELNTFPGQMGMTMLSNDMEYGLELLREVIMEPAFEDDAIDRIKTQLLAELDIFWDTPTDFIGQLARTRVYGTHPYGMSVMGSETTVKKIKKDDILEGYRNFISPAGGRLAIVGDLSKFDLKKVLNRSLGKWQGPAVPDIEFPSIKSFDLKTINHQINRDQIVLAYAGISVERLNKNFDALLIFDQILTGGVLGAMNSRLFDLRERTGLFYTIGGSVIAGSALQPGMIFIKSIVSPDRLDEAEKEILRVLAEGADTITEQEVEEAKRALINSFVDNFALQKQIAATFISLDIYGFGTDYFDKRPAELMRITVDDIKRIVREVLDVNKLVKIRAGRINGIS